ncbi:MAG: 4Fe-4S ferredoxin, partial [Alphaproteobacteria bacterium]|nr:4Fe-4S ferredoxin [Alphaproteobacteria bacterium]
MKVGGKKVLVCDCEGTIPLDAPALARALGATEAPAPNTRLCRAQIANAEAALKGTEPVLIACTQEAPLFLETQNEIPGAKPLSFVNIRERAGWSKDAPKAGPKIAALIAETLLDVEPTTAVTMESKGRVLVLGGEAALAAAQKLAGRLTPTVLLSPKTDAMPGATMDAPVFRGRIKSARGHLGAFVVAVAGCAAAKPSSRGTFAFPPTGDDGTLEADLILD